MPILLKIFAVLLIGHALCDYPLQGDFLARGKNRFTPLPGVPWYWCLGAHAAIHAGAVWMLTQVWWLGLLEFIFHALIDDTKCALANVWPVRDRNAADGFSDHALFNYDQAAHVVCKAVWVGLLWWNVR